MEFEKLRDEVAKMLTTPLEGEQEVGYVWSYRMARIIAARVLELEAKKPNHIRVVHLDAK